MINLKEIFNDDILWQFSIAERMAAFYLLDKMPCRKAAIEIGSYRGGFLHVLSRYFDKVYSLDIDHSNIMGKDKLKNVEFVQGDSKETLPGLVSRINETGEAVNLILIDGDHKYDAVIRDIENVLKLRPRKDIIMLIHDSWYEPSRNAINRADWNSCPYVEYIEKDFVPGEVMGTGHGNILIGGLALISLSPKAQKREVEIRQTYDFMYRIIKRGLENG